MVRLFGALTVAMGVLLAAPGASEAQSSFPLRPIRIVLPYAAGGGLDLTLRRIVQKVTDDGGPQIIVDNRGGGGGTVGTMAVKTAAPDGYTLLHGDHGTHAANVTLVKDLPYDPVKDFQPITLFYLSSPMLLVTKALPATTVAEFVSVARTRANKLNYASQGVGSGGHLAGSMLSKAIGAELVHVPYRGGGGAARTDLLAGRVDFLFNNYATFKGDVEAQNLRALAVAAPARLASAPHIPTMAEAGVRGVELETWFGLFAPAGVSREIVQKLYALFVGAVQSTEITGFLTEQGFTAKTTTPDEFAARIAQDIGQMAVLIKQAGAAPE